MILKLEISKNIHEIFQPLRDSRGPTSTQKTQPEASYWPSGAGDEVEEIMKELKTASIYGFPKKRDSQIHF